jgi:hypothetical protein
MEIAVPLRETKSYVTGMLVFPFLIGGLLL